MSSAWPMAARCRGCGARWARPAAASGRWADAARGRLAGWGGPLVSLSGGSILSVNGALIGFGGVGGNAVSVANSLCPCTSIGGLPVSLTGGAVAANVSITGAIKNGNLGALNLTPNAAVIRVDGAATKVTINGM